MIMDAKEFTNHYTKQDSDEAITPFQDEAGFSLIRSYPKETPYYKDGRRMFIKVAALDRGFFYGVDMTKPEKRGETTEYIITEGGEYKKKITNFISDGSSEFVVDNVNKKIMHQPTSKVFTLNEFVDILVANHLADRLFWKRKLNTFIDLILKTLFWLSDKHYERVRVMMDKYHFSQGKKPAVEEQTNIEPFFKYFYISKNFIFGVLLMTFLIAVLAAVFPERIPLKYIWHSLFGEFSLSNPMVVLLFFLSLFSSEKLSIWLNKNINNFLMPQDSHFSKQKESFIEKLHNYQFNNKFDLKLNRRINR